MSDATQITNYFSYSDLLAAGGQPSTEQLRLLKDEGFEIIINISPVSAKNAIHDEHRQVEQLQMDYVHFPVDCSNLREFHYLTFRSLLDVSKKKKTFVHCGGNIKTSNLIHMYNVLELGADESESLETLREIQEPEEKWFDYFKKMGMQGLQ